MASRIAFAALVALGALGTLAASPAGACDVPADEDLALRRALAQVQMLPQTREWDTQRRDAGELVQYELSLVDTYREGGKCHWTVLLRSNGKPWKRFYVSPDGRSIRDASGKPVRPARRGGG